jgi:hypothetical protein
MITLSQLQVNIRKIDFDNIVTDANMREHFGYQIPEGKVILDKMGKSKKKTQKGETRTALPGGPLEIVSKKKKANQPFAVTSQSRHIALMKAKKKVTTPPKGWYPPRQ